MATVLGLCATLLLGISPFIAQADPDTIPPTVAVTSTTPDGYYNEGDTIDVTLTFSENVTSTHALTVSFNSGGTCSILALTNALTANCTYTVQVNNNASDLTVSGISVDSGGTIKDAADNSANLTPTSNLAATSDIVIDTTDPVLMELTAILTPRNDTTPTYIFSSDEAGTIHIGGSCTATTTNAVVGTNALTFDALAEGSYTCSVSVTDAAGNQSVTINNIAVFVIDTTAPTVVASTATTAGTYSTGTPISVTLTFNESYVASFEPLTVTLNNGGSCSVPAMGGQTGSCAFQVQAGDDITDLQVASITVDNGGTLQDAAGNDANLVPTSNLILGINIDTTPPVITLLGSNPQDFTVGGTYVEAGATTDDGSTVVIDSSAVNTSAVGIYAVLYDSTDLVGNVATTVTRTVNVNADPNAANITLSLTTNPDTTVSGTFPGVTQAPPSGTPMSITLPAGTIVTGPSGWSGVFNFPSATTSFGAPTLQSGYSLVSSVGSEVGDMTYPLTLSRAARLVFPNKIGQYAGYSQNGTFTQITTTCAADDQTTADAMAAGADCYMNVGLDLVIWTKHLTTFVAYYQLPPAAASSGGGGGGNGPVAVSAPQNIVGEVLGAEDKKLGYYFTRSLKSGMSDEDVSALQMLLIELGHMTGEVTGYYGAKTAAAVKLYQKAQGLEQTGGVGPLTRAALNKGASVAGAATSKAPALTSAQAQAILGLLQSFGATQSVIDNVRKALGY